VTDDEIKEYINAQIKKVFQSLRPAAALPLDSDLQSRLDEVEDRLEALIRFLRALPPEEGFWDKFLAVYKTIKTRKGQDNAAAISELLARIEQSSL
jgi:hypothetical protein